MSPAPIPHLPAHLHPPLYLLCILTASPTHGHALCGTGILTWGALVGVLGTPGSHIVWTVRMPYPTPRGQDHRALKPAAA